MKKQRKRGYWSHERVLMCAQMFDTRKAFKLGDVDAYQAAQYHGWLGKVCAHMKLGYTRWSHDLVTAEAAKYRFRNDFDNGSPGAYSYARKHGLMDEICSHMEVIGNRHKRAIYALVFPDNSIYVGLSFDPIGRIRKHRNKSSNKNVRKAMIAHPLHYAILFEEWYTQEDASIAEDETILHYEANGYRILNIHKAGALGGVIIKWTKPKVLEVALTFDTRTKFKAQCGSAYNSARKNGWLDEVCAHMIPKQKPNGYWTRKRVMQVALQFSTRMVFHKAESCAYNLARSGGYLDEACAHMVSPYNTYGYWTYENCAAEALKYTNRSDLYKQSPTAYDNMRAKGWLDELCSHMKRKPMPKYWTLELVMEAAAKFNTRAEFAAGDNNAYKSAWKNGWLDEVCAHMKSTYKPHGYWTKERCREEASKYTSRSAFRDGSSSAYTISNRNKWMDEFFPK